MSHARTSATRTLVVAAALALTWLRGSALQVGAQPPPITITPHVHVTTDFGVWDAANAVIALPSGGFVAGGYSGNRCRDCDSKAVFALARYMPDGTLDPMFGTAGKVTSDFGALQQIVWDLALQPDGKLIAAGARQQTADDQFDVIVARYLRDGQLDTSFGERGHAAYDVGSGDKDEARAVGLLPDGRIVLAGAVRDDVAVLRLTSDGALDPSFGTGGISILDVATKSYAADLALLPDGRALVAAGANTSAPYYDMLVLCLDPAGNLDSSFATGGVATLRQGEPGSTTGRGRAVGLLADSRIQAAGEMSVIGSDSDHHVVRLRRDGRLERQFGDQGHLRYDVFEHSSDYTSAMVLRPDDSALVVGRTLMSMPTSSLEPGIGLAFLEPDGTLDSRFGSGASPGVAFVQSPYDTELWPAASASLGADRAVVASTQSYYVHATWNADFAMTIVGLPPLNPPPTATATAPPPTATATPTVPTPTAPAPTWTIYVPSTHARAAVP